LATFFTYVPLKTAVNYSRQGHGGFLYPEEAPTIYQQHHENGEAHDLRDNKNDITTPEVR
jgi:hypothetical protein